MKKTNRFSIIAFASCSIMFFTPVFAKKVSGIGNNEKCYYDNSGVGKYYFCGGPEKRDKCGPDDAVYHPCCDKEYVFGHGAKVTLGGKDYYCCERGESIGWIAAEGKPWITKTETKLEPTTNEDGSITNCTIKKEWTVCRKTVEDENFDKETRSCFDCTADAPFYRNQKCVANCGQTDKNMAFASLESNECVACETNAYQGIARLDQFGCKENENYDTDKTSCIEITNNTTNTRDLFNVCVKCNKETQYFDAEQGRCVDKSKQKKKSKSELRQCWLALSTRAYECCIEKGSEKFMKYNALSAEQQSDEATYPEGEAGEIKCCINGGKWEFNVCDRINTD